MDEFDVLLNDVLRTVANPELPERVRVQVRTRVWVQRGSSSPHLRSEMWGTRVRTCTCGGVCAGGVSGADVAEAGCAVDGGGDVAACGGDCGCSSGARVRCTTTDGGQADGFDCDVDAAADGSG